MRRLTARWLVIEDQALGALKPKVGKPGVASIHSWEFQDVLADQIALHIIAIFQSIARLPAQAVRLMAALRIPLDFLGLRVESGRFAEYMTAVEPKIFFCQKVFVRRSVRLFVARAGAEPLAESTAVRSAFKAVVSLD